jgi:hypothetical protein
MDRNAFNRLSKAYSTAGIALLNTVLFVCLLNVGLSGVFYVRDRSAAPKHERPPDDGKLFNSDGSPADNGKRSNYHFTWFDKGAYEDISEEYASDVLDDFYNLTRRGFIYQPWVEFAEPLFDGKRVHVDVDERGFPIRRTVNPPNQGGLPDVHVFAFGGSTTFGYNVSDEHTWPSYLSSILNQRAKSVHINVTNYGHAYFTPSQEAVLLADLLKSGHRPSIAVFMDGVNPPFPMDVPRFTKDLVGAFRRAQFPTPWMEQFSWVPVVRLSNFMKRRLAGEVSIDPPVDPEKRVQYAVNGFLQSREIARAIAEVYDIKTVFFLQPNSVYNYDRSLFRKKNFPQGFLNATQFSRRVYDQLKDDPGYLDLSGLFSDFGNRKAIVDDVHYSPAFNEFIARRVADSIDVNSMIPRQIDEASFTGISRACISSIPSCS